MFSVCTGSPGWSTFTLSFVCTPGWSTFTLSFVLTRGWSTFTLSLSIVQGGVLSLCSLYEVQAGVLSLCHLSLPRVEHFHFLLCLKSRVENIEVHWDLTDLMKGITMIGKSLERQKKQGGFYTKIVRFYPTNIKTGNRFKYKMIHKV